MSVVLLVDECALRSLLDLQPKEELKFSHQAHLELPAHLLRKSRRKSMRRTTKDDIIHVYLNNQEVVAMTQQEKSFVYRPYFKTHT